VIHCFRARPKDSLLASAPAASVTGRCEVALHAASAEHAAVDHEGASLVLSLQEAVRTGRISPKQAAAMVMAHLRKGEAAAADQGQVPSSGGGSVTGGCSMMGGSDLAAFGIGGGAGALGIGWRAPGAGLVVQEGRLRFPCFGGAVGSSRPTIG
jgi:hypothetical protein